MRGGACQAPEVLLMHSEATQMETLPHLQKSNFVSKVNASVVQRAASYAFWLGLSGRSHKCTVAKSTSSRLPWKSMPLLPLSYQAELLPPLAVYPSSPVEICASTAESCACKRSLAC